MMPLTRTCALTDYPGCTPVSWQQRLVDDAYTEWWPEYGADSLLPHVCLNLSGTFFVPVLNIAPYLIYCSVPTAFFDYHPTMPVASVVGLCVIDRIEAPFSFISRAGRILMPNGLLVLTFAFWDAEGKDVADGHELRRRIYNPSSWRELQQECRAYDLHPYGGIDWTCRGNVIGDRTIASLVLRKGDRR